MKIMKKKNFMPFMFFMVKSTECWGLETGDWNLEL